MISNDGRDAGAAGAITRKLEWRDLLVRGVRDWAAVVLVGTLALYGVARVGEDVFNHESTSFDGAIQTWMLAHQQPMLVRVFVWITQAGGVAPMCLLAVAGAIYVWFRGHRRTAATVLLAPTVAIVMFSALKSIYARPRPNGLTGIVPSSYAFPSGHATASTAICCTLAYVYWREGYIRRPTALLFAILVPLLVGLSRVYLNVHWATDVLGGWSSGLLIAVLSALLYDNNRRRRIVDDLGATPAR